jgi:hypothetical protein
VQAGTEIRFLVGVCPFSSGLPALGTTLTLNSFPSANELTDAPDFCGKYTQNADDPLGAYSTFMRLDTEVFIPLD